MIHQVAIKSLPQEWLWCETWCDDASKVTAKTIDLVGSCAFILPVATKPVGGGQHTNTLNISLGTLKLRPVTLLVDAFMTSFPMSLCTHSCKTL